MKNQNSRRSFLSSLAILTAGAAVAGTPGNLFSQPQSTNALQRNWISFCKDFGAKEYAGSATLCEINYTDTKGHTSRLGKVFHLQKENLLARPRWIYWANDKTNPADVLLDVYENEHPYKKLRTLNRYEMTGFGQLSPKLNNDPLIVACCTKINEQDVKSARLDIVTKIEKRTCTQQISYYKNQTRTFHKQSIINV